MINHLPYGSDNIDLEITQQVASPKSATQTSLNNNIKRNSLLLCKKQLNPIEEKELNTSHNSTFM